jgi:hypothetical protein
MQRQVILLTLTLDRLNMGYCLGTALTFRGEGERLHNDMSCRAFLSFQLFIYFWSILLGETLHN